MTTNTHDVNDLVRLFVKMRDALSARTKEYEEYKKDVKAKMDRVESALLAKLNEDGAESVRTESGTVYKTTKMKPSIRDFAALREYIMRTGHLDLLQKRVSSEALREIQKPDADGVVEQVPGVDVIYEAEVGVRRA